jgi:2-oxo-4-hydroxy-4-carboxy-5-ureidoimidazoline decarboxylase
MTGGLLSLGQVNSLGLQEFVANFGAIYEHSPWVAEKAWEARPFEDLAALEAAMRAVVRDSGRTKQLELLRAHPKLGTRRVLTDSSRAEQAGAGLLAAGEDVLGRLQALNAQYEQKFGFPFILAVRHANVATILDSCARRMNHDAQSEFDESLRQVYSIAHFRLSDRVDDGRSATR